MRVVVKHHFVRGGMCVTAVAIAAVAGASAAASQALTPMRGEVKSFSNQFALRVFPANPYRRRMKIEVRVYDETFRPVEARVMPAETYLAPEDNRSVLVVVPFEGRSERKIRICAESVPFDGTATQLRTQVCGRFLAQRVR